MSERLTTITLPGCDHGGISDWGTNSAEDMILAYRRYAAAQKRWAEQALADGDERFRVYSHTGVHAQRNVSVIQEGDDHG